MGVSGLLGYVRTFAISTLLKVVKYVKHWDQSTNVSHYFTWMCIQDTRNDHFPVLRRTATIYSRASAPSITSVVVIEGLFTQPLLWKTFYHALEGSFKMIWSTSSILGNWCSAHYGLGWQGWNLSIMTRHHTPGWCYKEGPGLAKRIIYKAEFSIAQVYILCTQWVSNSLSSSNSLLV